ncbi:hypothetical protein CGZ80_14485 [Rhodopirellula sp. MGV]|nr:hypothetical protein CGZ80_14485 [Rhodopirellula sp. MGV]
MDLVKDPDFSTPGSLTHARIFNKIHYLRHSGDARTIAKCKLEENKSPAIGELSTCRAIPNLQRSICNLQSSFHPPLP